MLRTRRLPLRLVPLVLALSFVAAAAPAAAQPTPLPGVGEVGQGLTWLGRLPSTPLAEGESIVFVARGVVGAAQDREMARLLIEGAAGGSLRVAVDFAGPFEADGVRVLLLDRILFDDVLVHEVPHAEDVEIALPGAGEGGDAAAPAVPAEAEVGLAAFPAGVGGGVSFSLYSFGDPSTVTGPVVPVPAFDVLLGTDAEVTIGGETFVADHIRFVARSTFPPPEAPSGILRKVDVYTSLPGLAFLTESVMAGVLFSGVPVGAGVEPFDVVFDPLRHGIGAVELGPTENAAGFVTGAAAGLAAAWEPAALDAAPRGGSLDLAAIGQNIRSVEVRGVVQATKTASGWQLSFQPPGGLGDADWRVEVDGVDVVGIRFPEPTGVFARSDAPPAGAEVFPIGVGDGAFYGFTWERPVEIRVPGADAFVGRRVRLTLDFPIGPLNSAGLSSQSLPPLTLTGLAAPAPPRFAGDAGGGLCLPTPTTLCLTGDRFAVRAAWADPFGASGAGIPHPLTADTGAFWFFEPSNLELMVKVLDACPLNDRFWVFAGGLTDVAVELTVTDTRTGAERVYENPQGRDFLPALDTAAFATCAP
jgi:hypothetical protein